MGTASIKIILLFISDKIKLAISVYFVGSKEFMVRGLVKTLKILILLAFPTFFSSFVFYLSDCDNIKQRYKSMTLNDVGGSVINNTLPLFWGKLKIYKNCDGTENINMDNI